MRGGGVIRRHIACDAGGGGGYKTPYSVLCGGGVIRRHIACDVGGVL